MKDAALVILAAGFGTRFKNGVKQLMPVGPCGELLIEYSIYDAIKAGFNKIVFVIRKDIEADMKAMIGDKLTGLCRVEYCFQDVKDIPVSSELFASRTKPWGTVQAVLAAKNSISEPFIIINADDYYGIESYKLMYEHITSEERTDSDVVMCGFKLKNTLSKNGVVTRGICTDKNGILESVTETYKVHTTSDGSIVGIQNGEEVTVSGDSTVSMNMWGCSPFVMEYLENEFVSFLEKLCREGDPEKAELTLPEAFDRMIKNNSISVRVLNSSEVWYGMTVSEDRDEVKEAFGKMTEEGVYPSPLLGSRALI